MRNVRIKAGFMAAGAVMLLFAACGDEKPVGGRWAEDPPWKACETADCPTNAGG